MELKLACSHVGPHSQLSMLFKAMLILSLSMGLSLVVCMVVNMVSYVVSGWDYLTHRPLLVVPLCTADSATNVKWIVQNNVPGTYACLL